MTSTPNPPRHILLTGVPGVGKTTLVTKIWQEFNKHGIACSGFITEEVRSGHRRSGFDVVTMDGQRGQLARVSDRSNELQGATRRQYKVGQYSVNLLSFEQVALPTLQAKRKGTGKEPLYLVDEIGKMELFSQSFIQSVRRLLTQKNTTLVATIPVIKTIHFVEELRNGADSVVFEVTKENRDSILSDILAAIQTSLQSCS